MFSEFKIKITFSLLALLACTLAVCDSVSAQRPRFDDFFASQPQRGSVPGQVLQNVPGGVGNAALPMPGTIINPAPIQLSPPPSVLPSITVPGNLGQGNFSPGNLPPVLAPGSGAISGGLPNLTAPAFDPYRTPNQSFPIFPRAQQQPVLPQPVLPQPVPQTFPQGGFVQPNLPNIQPFPQAQPQGGIFGPAPRYNGAPGYGAPMPNQSRWPYEGTGTNWLPSVDWTWPQQAWQTFRTQFLPRVLERPRARQTYIHGNNGNELNINDIEIATTATLPNFLQGPTPLRISPGFAFHFWDGPDSNVHPGFDLPSRAYSTTLAFDHITDTTKVSGFENNFTIGYYSDFDNTSSDAIRLTAKLLGWYRLNQYTVGKLGVEYFDRVNVKLLPAVGLYMTPNPDMKLDLYFPRTKLSHRIPNLADLEAWAYVGAEYGGGSWAIQRRDGSRDQADINDVRAFVGLEWMGPRRVTGFLDFGYVFERELVYRSNALNTLDLQDSLMLRSGIAF